MAKLDLAQAPSASLPLGFLLTTPGWGVVAGGLLIVDGAALLQSRWAPGTLALVHAVTLGVLGNAMAGSLLQFLPAAAGVRVGGGAVAARWLHALLNLGALLLVLGFRQSWHWALTLAGPLLAGAFALLAWMTLPGVGGALWRRSSRLALHAGLAFALAAALATAALGIAMLAGLVGGRGLPLLPWVDVHAGWGLLGWTGGLLVSVGSVVMPMFQGTRPPSSAALFATLWCVLVVLSLGSMQAAGFGSAGFGSAGFDGAGFAGAGFESAGMLRSGAGVVALVAALSALWLQVRAPHARNRWLVQGWRAGLAGIVAAGAVLVAGGSAVWIGVLLLGIALPWLVTGMQLEIVAFLAWIRLHRDSPRGIRLPPVQTLIPDARKARMFGLQCVATVALLAAVAWPTDAFARLAGTALVLGQSVLWATLRGAGRRADAFLARLSTNAEQRA